MLAFLGSNQRPRQPGARGGVFPPKVTYPGNTPTHVREFPANDYTEEFVDAIDALDGVMDLTRPGAARLLVVVSDGIFRPDQRDLGTTRINRLIANGCGVLSVPRHADIDTHS